MILEDIRMAHIIQCSSPPTDGFDETMYLRMNPDIRQAVEQGKTASGWRHFVVQGYRENRAGAPAALIARLKRADTVLTGLPLPLAGFGEAAYLAANPDIRAAVEAGKLASGWSHFLAYGYRENRPGVHPAVYAKLDSVLGVDEAMRPPAHLRHRVHGSEDPASFDAVGRVVADCLDYALSLPGCGLPRDGKILDFGCGCGRVIRYFKALQGGGEFFATDIDAEAIAWCEANLADSASFAVNREMPPLAYPDGFFDLVYSVSIFTHLPEDMQFAWLGELRRVTKPGSHLLLTVHGDNIFPEQLKKKSKNGFYYAVGQGTQGLPAFYQTSFHSDEYVRGVWGKYFEIVNIFQFPAWVGVAQRFVLCRRVA